MPPSDGVSVRTLWSHSEWTSPLARELSVTAPLCLSCQSPLRTMMMMIMMLALSWQRWHWLHLDEAVNDVGWECCVYTGGWTETSTMQRACCYEGGGGGGDCPGWPEGEVSLWTLTAGASVCIGLTVSACCPFGQMPGGWSSHARWWDLGQLLPIPRCPGWFHSIWRRPSGCPIYTVACPLPAVRA